MPSQAECHSTSEVTTGITGGIKPKAMSLSVHIKSIHLHEWLLTKRVRLFLSATDPGSASRTCESSQFDTAGHVVIKEDSSSFVVALDDGIQSLRTDAVAWHSGGKISLIFFSFQYVMWWWWWWLDGHEFLVSVVLKSNFTGLCSPKTYTAERN